MDREEPPLRIVVTHDAEGSIADETIDPTGWDISGYPGTGASRPSTIPAARCGVDAGSGPTQAQTQTQSSAESGGFGGHHYHSEHSSSSSIPPATPAAEAPYKNSLIYESAYTRIYRVSDGADLGGQQHAVNDGCHSLGSGSSDGWCGTVAVKTLFGSSPPPVAISELHNEYRILKENLSSCPSARVAIKQGSFGDSDHAIHLRWVDGRTLREWAADNPVPGLSRHLRAAGGGEEVSSSQKAAVMLAWTAHGLPRYIRVMCAMAKALADVHMAGVAHLNLSLDNIIIQEGEAETLRSGSDDGGHGNAENGSVRNDNCNGSTEGEGIRNDNCNSSSSSVVTGQKKDFQATLIDFGRACNIGAWNGTIEGTSSHSTEFRIQEDLNLLGAMFLELLRGSHCDRGSGVFGSNHILASSTAADKIGSRTSSNSSLRRRTVSHALSKTPCSLVPESLLLLVSGLIEPSEEREDVGPIEKQRVRSTTAWGVAQELESIARSLSQSPLGRKINDNKGPFEFDSNQLFGRDEQLTALLSAYGRFRSTPQSESLPLQTTEIVLLEGYSGTGKSALAHRMRDPVTADAGFFISGKFDQLCHAEPYSALSSAFIELCDLILAMDDQIIAEIRKSILDTIEQSWRILAYIIPNLRQIIVPDSLTSSEGDSEPNGVMDISRDSFHFIFQLFLKAICRKKGPIVLFIDDMQWADTPSLDLLKALLTDTEIASLHSFMFLGAYRSNEVESDHPLCLQLESIETSGVTVSRIEVGDLSNDVVNSLIATALDMPPHLCLSLAKVVYQKTNGNVFYTLELLRSLCDEGLLRFSMEHLSWQWEEDAIQERDIADNVVGLLSSKILKLPSAIGTMMMIAACIGAQFDEEILRLIACGTSKAQSFDAAAERRERSPWTRDMGAMQSVAFVGDTLQALVDDGLLYKLTSDRFKFAHDRVQQAAYSLIPTEEKSTWHYHVGSTIRERASRRDLEKMIFTVADQMNRGVSAACSRSEQVVLACLNLRAGKKAMSSSAFVSATSYLRAGVDLLNQDQHFWESEYDLSLRLHNSYAAAAYCNGNFDQMEEIIEKEILRNARSLHDKVTGYILSIKVLAARDKLREAIAKGFEVLKQLTEPFPSQVTKKTLVMEVVKTKFALRGKSDADIVSLPAMKDKTKMAAMEVLSIIFAFSFMAKTDVIPLLVFRMVRLSIRYGVCGVSSYAFALYGLVLCGALGDIERGFRYGQVALSLLKRSKSPGLVARVFLIVYGLVNHWKLPLKGNFQPLLDGYNAGMKAGDVETAMIVVHAHCGYRWHFGCPLDQTEEVFKKFHQVMIDHNQDVVSGIHLIIWQATLNLRGRGANQVELTGEVMNQSQITKDIFEKGNSMELCFLYYFQMLLAFIFGEHVLAAEMGEKSRIIAVFSLSNFFVTQQKFYEGLNAMAMFRETKKRKWFRLARANKMILKKWDRLSSGNRFHMILLLKAELSSLKSKPEKTKVKYDSAILEAGKAGFRLDEAIANERAALFSFGCNEEDQGKQYMRQSLECYDKICADAKVNQLRIQFPWL